MINKGGLSYWVPLTDKSQSISSYSKWDQAFRVFLDVYTSQYPEQTSELIQYGHIIQMAAYTYSWENVYLYDREFRRHMERHPERSWGVILQQAWTMFLKDRLNSMPGHKTSYGNNGHQTESRSGVVKKLCFAFNRGECKLCKFDHRCGFCGKFGHGTFNCRRANGNGNGGNGGNGGPLPAPSRGGNNHQNHRSNGGGQGHGQESKA